MEASNREITHRANFLIYNYLKDELRQAAFAEDFKKLIQNTEYKDVIRFKGLGNLVEILTQQFKQYGSGEAAEVKKNKKQRKKSKLDVEISAADTTVNPDSTNHDNSVTSEAAAAPAADAVNEVINGDTNHVNGEVKKKSKKKKKAKQEEGKESVVAVDAAAAANADESVTELQPVAAAAAAATAEVEEQQLNSETKKKKKKKSKRQSENVEEKVEEEEQQDLVKEEVSEVNGNEVVAAEADGDRKRKCQDDYDEEEPADAVEAKKQRHGEPYRRVKEDEIENKHFRDNSFDAKKNARDSWGFKANLDLKPTQGKSFRHEKTKKKRGSYKGGAIDTAVTSVKFGSDSE